MNAITLPLVSVVIPCYNQGAYVEECIQSVLNQKYANYEIIVVNDGSTCNSTNRLLHEKQFAKTVIYHTANNGLSAARNFGISNSSGKYILPLDADDMIGPNYISAAVPALEMDSEIGIIYSNGEYIGARVGPIEHPEFTLEQMLLNNIIFCSGLYRRDDWKTVAGYKSDMVYGMEDYDFWLSIISLGRKVVRLPEYHFFYRVKPRSMAASITVNQNTEMRKLILARHRRLYIDNLDALLLTIFADNKKHQRLLMIAIERLGLALKNLRNRVRYKLSKYRLK